MAEAKYADSLQKLGDFVYTVEQLAMPESKKGELLYKIDPVAVGEMAMGANGAIECI
jgi:hypothetical protein